MEPDRRKNEQRQLSKRRQLSERRLNQDRRLQSNDPVIAYIQQHAAPSSTQDVANVMDLTL